MRSLVAALAAVLVLSACQDPAGVGLGLIDEEQLDPSVLSVPLSDVGIAPDTTIAIGIASGVNADLAQTRILVGDVADPVFGDVSAIAYLDLIQPASFPDDATVADVTQAWLELRTNYLYGDTTTTLPLDLRPISETWMVDTSYERDRTFATGDVLVSSDVSAEDTLRRFDLPASWVSETAATLIGDDFVEAFEGFELSVPSDFMAAPGAVYGFSTFESTGSGLRVVIAGDTLVYPLSEVFSSISAEEPSTPSTDLLPLRSSTGSALRFEVDFETVGASALAQARIRLPLLDDLSEEGTFVRPIPSRAILFGVDVGDDARELALSELILTEEELAVVDTGVLTNLVQGILLNPEVGFDRFEVRPARGTASLDVLPILLSGTTPETRPRISLTVVGSAN